MRTAFATFVLLATLLGGCVQSPTITPDPVDPLALLPWEELGALIYSEDHDHRDRGLHTEIARGLKVLNQSTLSDNGLSLGEYTEADHERGIIAIAIVTGPGSTMRIVLLRESDLPALTVASYFDEPNSYGDVKLDPQRPLVYVPYPSGPAFSIWDISKLGSPRRVSEAPGAGCHMLHVLPIGGTSHVFCATVGGSSIYRIQETPLGPQAVLVGTAFPQSDPEVARYLDYYETLTPLGPVLLTTPHDQTAQLDPLTGAPILVTAHELQGIRIFDVSTPSAPREISRWRGAGMGDVLLDRVHTVGIAEVNGRRLGFGATETFTNVPPALYIVDFSDWANPKFLTRWIPPGIHFDQGLTYSLHNLQVVGTRLYLTNFHAGLWVLDIADPENPITIALRTPVLDTEYPRPGESSTVGAYTWFVDQNQFWDVIVVNGYTIVTDMAAGIEVLLVDGDPAGDPDYDGFT
jgi:hypothetical protein